MNPFKVATLFIAFLFVISVGPDELFGQDAVDDPCSSLEVNIKKGTINGISATDSRAQVKEKLPCFTGETEDNDSGMNCGGGVFYLNHDFFIYIKNDFMRVRKKFKGELSIPVLGKSVPEVRDLMGEPDDTFVHTDEWLGDKTTYMQYKMKWGVLAVLMTEGTVSSLEFHYGVEIGNVNYCF